MPTYEYRCTSCKHQFEVFARMSDPDPEACESCGAASLEKVLFPVAVHYKGSGFYSTDYSGSGTAGAGSSAGGDAGSSTSPTSDGAGSSATTDSSSSTTESSGGSTGSGGSSKSD